MKKILKGLKKFQTLIYPLHQTRFEELAENQDPDVLFITCSDSRVDPNLITQMDPGELFICRNASKFYYTILYTIYFNTIHYYILINLIYF